MDKGSSPIIKKVCVALALVMAQQISSMTWGQFFGWKPVERSLGQRIGVSAQPTTVVDIVAQHPRLVAGTTTTIAGLIALNSYSKYSMLKDRYKDLTNFVQRNRAILRALTQNPNTPAYAPVQKVALNSELISYINSLNDAIGGSVDIDTFKNNLEKDKNSLPYTFFLPELLAANIKKFQESLDIILTYINAVDLARIEQEIQTFGQPQQQQPQFQQSPFYGAASHYPYPMPQYPQQYYHQQPQPMSHAQQFHNQLMERYRIQFFTWLQDQGYREIPEGHNLVELFRRWVTATFSKEVAQRNAQQLQQVLTSLNLPIQPQIGYQGQQHLEYTPESQSRFSSQLQQRIPSYADIEALGQQPVQQQQPSSPAAQQPSVVSPPSSVASQSSAPERSATVPQPAREESYYDWAKGWLTRKAREYYLPSFPSR